MEKKSAKALEDSSYLGAGGLAYLDQIYDQYLQDPASVPEKWRQYFDEMVGSASSAEVSPLAMEDKFLRMAKTRQPGEASAGGDVSQEAVDRLINCFRRYGHHESQLDPLKLANAAPDPRLTPAYHGLTASDMSRDFLTRGVLVQERASLSAIVSRLRQLYCGTVGFEFMYIEDQEKQDWLRDYVESKFSHEIADVDRKKRVLKSLTAAEGLEHYLDVKYPGQKRFSIEGLDTMVPMLNELTVSATAAGIQEVVFSMAHRGRLNVCVNVVGKPPKLLFEEYEGKHDKDMTTGDVKYHLGYSADIKNAAGVVHTSLLFNPSHLDYICPVQLGSVRGRQDRYAKNGHKSQYALGIMIHGDAAFSTQGINAEVFQLSRLRAYKTGGTVHVVSNNQIGYTTANPADARSSRYCTDMAKTIEIPVIHVNADDAEAVVTAMDLAFAYRQRFEDDVVVDLVGYRRLGHQEVDEPRATQPVMYQVIRQHPTQRTIYAEQLVKAGVVSEADVNAWKEDYRDRMDRGVGVIEQIESENTIQRTHADIWTSYLGKTWRDAADTTISPEKVKWLGERITDYPSRLKLLRQVNAIMVARKKMADGEVAMDWGFAETMAYASLVDAGVPVRFSGEDSRRGTFFHRHATLFDQDSGEEYTPLDHISPEQAPMELYDSMLAELGPLGFEYGYSTARPTSLVIWEAQFGDFANSAQVMVDQFISSAWHKWKRLSGLVMLLPHGYEGMGPEHSSARLERYMQLCAQDNMQVCVPTTPAQIFHLLRRQVIRPFRMPLVVMTPKSLLRHKLAVSPLSDLSEGHFHPLIPEVEPELIQPENVKRVVLCSGKVYYDLLEKRREKGQNDVALIRIEQLYPFPYEEVKAVFAQYNHATSILWCQEEPRNQGAWYITRHRIVRCMNNGKALLLSSRPAMAAPAAGYPALNKQQQELLVQQALDLDFNE
jgi:2-oxoglutarate dehydrogenase E1 component